MTEKQFIQSLRISYKLFSELGVAYSCANMSSLVANKEFNKVALDISRPYHEVFFSGLSLQQYNFLLKDYSFFQFSHKSQEDIRFAFYPSPFDYKQLEEIQKINKLFEEGLIDSEEQTALFDNIDTNSSRPLVRYEYNTNQYEKGLHPASHFHIGTYGDDRWIVRKILTPYAFSLYIAKLYYRDHWEALTEFNNNQRVKNEFDLQLYSEKEKCLLTPDDYFSDHEENVFYFS